MFFFVRAYSAYNTRHRRLPVWRTRPGQGSPDHRKKDIKDPPNGGVPRITDYAPSDVC